MTETTPRPDGHVNHGDQILDRHDFRDWVEWPAERGKIRIGTRVRHEYVQGGQLTSHRTYVHPDDVPTDPDAELVERVASGLMEATSEYSTTVVSDYLRGCARGVIALVRDHDKADR
jgi:hypothetical protein